MCVCERERKEREREGERRREGGREGRGREGGREARGRRREGGASAEEGGALTGVGEEGKRAFGGTIGSIHVFNFI